MREGKRKIGRREERMIGKERKKRKVVSLKSTQALEDIAH